MTDNKSNNDQKQVFSLLQVCQSIERTINTRYQRSYWIKAEIIKLNYYKKTGNSYPDLVEKNNNKIVAQIRANIWKNDFTRINLKFKNICGEPLKDGIKILLLANINYNPLYGFSLNIVDIDANYTLGDLELEKIETIQKLENEGIINNNKNKLLPQIIKRIAIISIDTSKGYQDFVNILKENEIKYNYKFDLKLYPSILQGDNAITSIITQLKNISNNIQNYDAVAIIRGGGGDLGLTCYNNYRLASVIAKYPIPIITGIGHASNHTVVEIICHTNKITPSKLAEFIVENYTNFDNNINMIISNINKLSKNKIDFNLSKLNNTADELTIFSKILLDKNKNYINDYTRIFIINSKSLINQFSMNINHKNYNLIEKMNSILNVNKLELYNINKIIKRLTLRIINDIKEHFHLIDKILDNNTIKNILIKGFSILSQKSKIIKNIEEIELSENIDIQLINGKIIAKPIKLEKDEI